MTNRPEEKLSEGETQIQSGEKNCEEERKKASYITFIFILKF